MNRAHAAIFAFALAAAASGCTTRQAVVESAELRGPATATTAAWVREELFFGLNIPGGGSVTDSAFYDFVDREILRRFPDGFTLYDVTGYYRMRDPGAGMRRAVEEPTRILMVVYREDDPAKSRALGELAEIYKRLFRQESVLRITQRVRVVF